MLADTRALARGFADPVPDSQQTFRTVLDAMARPGRVLNLPPRVLASVEPGVLSGAMATLLLTLVDTEVRLWLDIGSGSADAAAFLRFHTDVTMTPERLSADIVATQVNRIPSDLWQDIRLGSDERPQDGATVIVQVTDLHPCSDRDPGALVCEGPGIASYHALRVAGMDDGFWHARRTLADRFPCGAELILCDAERIAAFPRTTRVTCRD